MTNFEQIQSEKQEQYNRVKEANLLEIPVLDKGFVRLIDWMGSDKDITRSARISYNNHEQEKTDEQDERLIDYLMEHGHTSPCEIPQIRIHVKMPMFVARQWIRHRTWSVNEISGRYTELKNEFYLPLDERVQGQDSHNKQGSNGKLPEETTNSFLSRYISDALSSFRGYTHAIEAGVAKEIARIGLPPSTYTEMIFSVDLHNLLKFLSLRTHPTAQWEIQEYGRALESIVRVLYPWVYKSYMNHHRNKMSFSGKEVEALKEVFQMLLGKADPSAKYDIINKQVDSRHWKDKISKLLG